MHWTSNKYIKYNNKMYMYSAEHNNAAFDWINIYSHAPITADSVCAVSVICGLPQPEKKNWKIKEINGSQVSKHVPSENGP